MKIPQLLNYLPLPSTPAKPLPRYEITVRFTMGDCEGNEDVTTIEEDEIEVLRTLESYKTMPQHPNTGGDDDVWDNWKETQFTFDVPHDPIYQIDCAVEDIKVIYFDKDGAEFLVRLK